MPNKGLAINPGSLVSSGIEVTNLAYVRVESSIILTIAVLWQIR